MTIDAVREVYERCGQGHVFDLYDELSEDEKRALIEQLERIDIASLGKNVLQAIESSKNAKSVQHDDLLPIPASSSGSILDSESAEVDKWKQLGRQQIRAGKVAVIVMAGGQGTRLGSSAPKGCYDIGLFSHKSLFQLQAERILKLQSLTGATKPIPWYIMTSGPTHQPTIDFFAAHNYFGCSKDQVIFFSQGILPCFTETGRIILESPSKVAVAPDGNGGLYLGLVKSGVLDDMKRRGIEHVHTYAVDNCLVKIADPAFIGFAMSRKASIASKVVRKRDAGESVGLILCKNNRPAVLEYSEISPELMQATESTANGAALRFRAANIVNHYYSMDFLSQIPSWDLNKYLPFHAAYKKIPYYSADAKSTIKPSEPNGYKLEQFVFDVFPQVPLADFALFEVDRKDEFSPLKNASGTKSDNPETSRNDLLFQGARWVKAAGGIPPEGGVEVAPLTSYEGEGLEFVQGKELLPFTIL
ncbi:hypothetical protein CANCADRAFT_31478 [Tortispora caseinolytica NRRL Y-17796]|uniref:UDP-N-acetylglucosamine diphosphorylase n=1 Tax=Tortispora caseinolytica NRRL Y-17796 TaxID=767744 RepID=A0A1E4TFM4_9ASCO|nr:hypothetical protein CANCADRAFT_31478 [Tortispora caseinolytica NRRL Y-17796]